MPCSSRLRGPRTGHRSRRRRPRGGSRRRARRPGREGGPCPLPPPRGKAGGGELHLHHLHHDLSDALHHRLAGPVEPRRPRRPRGVAGVDLGRPGPGYARPAEGVRRAPPFGAGLDLAHRWPRSGGAGAAGDGSLHSQLHRPPPHGPRGGRRRGLDAPERLPEPVGHRGPGRRLRCRRGNRAGRDDGMAYTTFGSSPPFRPRPPAGPSPSGRSEARHARRRPEPTSPTPSSRPGRPRGPLLLRRPPGQRGGGELHLHPLHRRLPAPHPPDERGPASLGDRFGRDVRFVSISVDPEFDTPQELRRFVEDAGGRLLRLDLAHRKEGGRRPRARGARRGGGESGRPLHRLPRRQRAHGTLDQDPARCLSGDGGGPDAASSRTRTGKMGPRHGRSDR